MDRNIVLFIFISTVTFHVVASLDCYSCNNASYAAQCSAVTQCPPGHICYATIDSNGYTTLGCRDSQLCPTTQPTIGTGSIIGRSAPSGTVGNCSECCETGMCNRQLCQNGGCNDSGRVDCVVTGSLLNLCVEAEHAKKECRKFCGLCSMVDGGWSPWSAWSSCSTSCGNGTVTRTRGCLDPAPANGGTDCPGTSHDTSTCTNGPCPVNGGWNAWSPWGSCSVTCGIGLQRRDRACSKPYPSNFGDHCFGDARDDRICMAAACQDGGWSAWGAWSTCSRTCATGTRRRSRDCTNPAPSVLGRNCVGDNSQMETCSDNPCYHDIGFTANGPKDTGTSGRITFSNTLINKGGNYNTTTGEFTCTVAGSYTFSLKLLKSQDAYYVQCNIYKNSIDLDEAYVYARAHADIHGELPASATVYVHLLPGDKVYTGGCTAASTMIGGDHCTFTGFLLHAD